MGRLLLGEQTPELLVLRDGRQFVTEELLSQVTRPRIHRLGVNHHQRHNFSHDERVEIANSDVRELMDRYGWTYYRAKNMKYNNMNYVSAQEILKQNPIK